MGGLHYTRIKTAIYGMAAFNITQVQADNVIPKNHRYRVLGQEGECCLSWTFCLVLTKYMLEHNVRLKKVGLSDPEQVVDAE